MDKAVVVKYVEEELKNYKETIRQIEEIRIEILSSTPTKQPRVAAGRPDPTASKAVNLVSNTVLCRMERTVRAINKALDSLPEEKVRFFKLKYIQHKTKKQICRELCISERTYHRWRKAIVTRVARELGLIDVA